MLTDMVGSDRRSRLPLKFTTARQDRRFYAITAILFLLGCCIVVRDRHADARVAATLQILAEMQDAVPGGATTDGAKIRPDPGPPARGPAQAAPAQAAPVKTRPPLPGGIAAAQDRCGDAFHGENICNCVDYSMYCNERTGWCGETAKHKAESFTGRYNCPTARVPLLQSPPPPLDMIPNDAIISSDVTSHVAGAAAMATEAEPSKALITRGVNLGLIFPFTSMEGTQRARIVELSWRCLCRAIKTTPKVSVHVLVIDDRQGDHPKLSSPPWYQQSKERTAEYCAPNVASLDIQEGLGSINRNTALGYKWASQYDFIMNLDSDLLVVESFFASMLSDYQQALEYCETPVISGYTSQKWGRAYGANYMVAGTTYNSWAGASIEEVAIDCSQDESECRCRDGVCRAKPWDDNLMKSHAQYCKGDGDRVNCDTDVPGRCHGWPVRPINSYVQHLSDPDGMHFQKDGVSEQAVRFPWSSWMQAEVIKLGGDFKCFSVKDDNQQDSGHEGYRLGCD